MAEIYLCRHGQSVANANGILAGHLDTPLTDVGKKQAQELATLANNAKLQFDYVYTSPLRRARQTAGVISEETSSPIPKVINDLIERDFGVLTGRPYADIPKFAKQIIGTEKIGYFLQVEGSESYPQVLKRARKVLKIVGDRHNSGNVLLVTHDDMGKMLFAAFHKSPWKSILNHFHFGNSEFLLLHKDSKHQPHVFEIDQRGTVEKV